MEYEKIKSLIDDFGNSKLNSLDLDFSDGTKLQRKTSVLKFECKILVQT